VASRHQNARDASLKNRQQLCERQDYLADILAKDAAIAAQSGARPEASTSNRGP
jgi:hypothetical protein